MIPSYSENYDDHDGDHDDDQDDDDHEGYMALRSIHCLLLSFLFTRADRLFPYRRPSEMILPNLYLHNSEPTINMTPK